MNDIIFRCIRNINIEDYIEYDGKNYYATSTDASGSSATDIRKILPNINYFRIDSDTNPISGTSTDIDVFTGGAFKMAASGYYLIEWHMFWTRTANPASVNTYKINTPSGAVYVVGGASNILAAGTVGSMSFSGTAPVTVTSFSGFNTMASGNHYHYVKAYVLNGANIGAPVKLQINQTAAGIILRRGSYIMINRMPNNNFGNFV